MTARAELKKVLVRRFVASGETESMDWQAWSGSNVIERARAHHDGLIDALLSEIERRTRRTRLPAEPAVDWSKYVTDRLTPMVHGLVPPAAQEAALRKLVGAAKLVTPGTVKEVLRGVSFLSTAWNVANLYLDAVGAKPLDSTGWAPLGLTAGDACYVSVHYVTKSGPLDDFVVHEAAHMLNDTKRRDVGLPQGRNKEWLLGIWFRHRELFAYSCEVWSRVVALAPTPRGRRALVEDVAREGPFPNDSTVDRAEFVDVLRDAAAARSGWKRILTRCQEPRASTAPR